VLIIGLTGSIGMGKSTVAARFRALGVPVCDADAEVHKLYAGAAAPLIETAFPGTASSGSVDRAKLAAVLMQQPQRFKELEAIIHPLVFEAERAVMRKAAESGAPMLVLEVPLLFETGGEKRCDVTVVVSAPADKQRERVMLRPGMTAEKLEALLERQVPDAEKRARADFIVDTGTTIPETEAQVDKVVAALQGRRGTAFEQYWA